MAGKFIVLEGLDGSGKSTQLDLLFSRIRRNYGSAIRGKSPDADSPTGKLIYGHLKGEWSAIDMKAHPLDAPRIDGDPLVFQALQTVNRYETGAAIAQALANGTHVIYDRYFTSGLVYGRVDGLDPQWLDRVHELLPQPDLAIYLDISLKESIERRPMRRDRYEENAEFLGKVRGTYLSLFDERYDRGYRIIDGHGTIAGVHERIWQEVSLVMDQLTLQDA